MSDIMLIGEAWGEKEAEVQRPFVGASGFFLNQMLGHAGISRGDCYTTNVFNLQPQPKNDIKNLCGPKASALPGFPPLTKGLYVRAEYEPELSRLYQEIRETNPNIILALGATAAWALLHTSGIKAVRGAVAPSHAAVSRRLGREYKVLPTYHPAMVLRDYSARPVVISDFAKALRESTFPEVRRPQRNVWLYPELLDLAAFEREHIIPCERLACDIETKGNQITCIGFAPSDSAALVIPIFSPTSNTSYWSPADEREVWRYVARWLALRPSIFQNGMYDLHVLWRYYGISAPLACEDTMLQHHSLQPEMQKGLGFLATIYTDEASWKGMRKGLKHDA